MKNELAVPKKSSVPKKQATMPATLLEIAVSNNADIERLKELMDLQERWEKKEARKAFSDAMSTFQTMVPVIRKNRIARIATQKGSYSYRFADLGEITKAIKHALKECGLSYRWSFNESGGKLKVTCIVSHRDGHEERTEMEAGMDNSGAKNDIQQKGSTQTYLQRYTLIGALGLSTAEEDVDGQGHKTTAATPTKREASTQQVNQTDEEFLDQWQQAVTGVKSQLELRSLYTKNQNVVLEDPRIQAIFKARETQLKGVKSEKIDMP